jgi:hypothetical protein
VRVTGTDFPGYNITVRKIEYLTGQAMKDACAADGITNPQSEKCKDYYVREKDTTDYPLRVSPTGGAVDYDYDPNVPLGQFAGQETTGLWLRSIAEHTTQTRFWTIEVRGGYVQLVEPIFTP